MLISMIDQYDCLFFSIKLARILKENMFMRVKIFSNLTNFGTLWKNDLFRTQSQKATPSRKVFDTYSQKPNKQTFELTLGNYGLTKAVRQNLVFIS